MTKLIEQLSEAFHGKRTRIEVTDEMVKWGWPREMWGRPFTLLDEKRLLGPGVDPDDPETMARICVSHLEDENGEALFEKGDVQRLKRNTPTVFIKDIATQILRCRSSEEEERGKSSPTPAGDEPTS